MFHYSLTLWSSIIFSKNVSKLRFTNYQFLTFLKACTTRKSQHKYLAYFVLLNTEQKLNIFQLKIAFGKKLWRIFKRSQLRLRKILITYSSLSWSTNKLGGFELPVLLNLLHVSVFVLLTKSKSNAKLKLF